MDERVKNAGLAYDRAIFNGDSSGLAAADSGLDAVEADLAVARGRLIHARFLEGADEDPRELALFERAAELYAVAGNLRGEAEALFWIGIFHQLVRRDNDAAVPAFERSRDLATRADDPLTLSYSLRHLGIAEHAAGRLAAARERLAESTRLRREIGLMGGVAANLVGLIYIAAAEGRRTDALALADEAEAIAEAADARAILRQVHEAREAL